MPTYNSTIGVLNLELYAGDRNHYELTFTADGQVWDMTGAAVTAQARVRASAVNSVFEATIDEVDASVGKWTMEWNGEDVRTAIGQGESWNGVWDLQVIESGQTLPITLVRGSVRALMDVTR